jgi:hypothetical protein
MPGVIFPIPTDASGAPEANRWQGTQTEPTLAQRIAGHAPYPGAPPAYDIENYARDAQWQNNLRLQAAALVAERQSQTVTLAGATVGNQRRIVANGTNIDYSDTIGQTVSDVADSFALAINANVTVTAGANAVYAVGNIAGAGTVTILSLVPGIGTAALVVTVAVLAGAGTITVGTLTAPDIVISEDLIGSTTGNIVLGFSADDAGSNNDVRLVLDRNNNAFRAGGVPSTEWDTRSLNSVGIGWRADPQADNALALGTQAVAAAIKTIAIGNTATATLESDIAIGDGATANSNNASGLSALAVGDGASATDDNAVALGRGANASQVQAIAIGTSTAASAADAVAIGAAVAASAARAIAIGSGPDATFADAIAMGTDAQATAVDAVAIGHNALATADNAIGIGEDATASAANATAIGQLTQATADGALATGHAANLGNVLASADGARAHGLGGATVYAVTASGTGSEAQGRGAVASGAYSEAMGFGATATNRGEAARASLGITDIAGPSVEAATHQAGRLVVQCRTPASTTRRFRADAIDQTTGATWTPMDDRGYYVKIKAVGKSESSGAAEIYTGEAVITKDAGTVAKDVGFTALTFVAALGGGFTTASIAVSVSGGTFILDATVGAGLDVRWTAEIEYVQAGINY